MSGRKGGSTVITRFAALHRCRVRGSVGSNHNKHAGAPNCASVYAAARDIARRKMRAKALKIMRSKKRAEMRLRGREEASWLRTRAVARPFRRPRRVPSRRYPAKSRDRGAPTARAGTPFRPRVSCPERQRRGRKSTVREPARPDIAPCPPKTMEADRVREGAAANAPPQRPFHLRLVLTPIPSTCTRSTGEISPDGVKGCGCHCVGQISSCAILRAINQSAPRVARVYCRPVDRRDPTRSDLPSLGGVGD